MKKLKDTIIILTGILALTAIAPLSASATPTTEIEVNKQFSQQVEVKSAGDYIAWLKGQDGSKEILDQFTMLSESDQEKFVEYINDPIINKTLMDVMASSNGEEVSLYGGDIVARQSQSIALGDISIRAADYEVSQKATSTILGIDVVEISERVEYRVQGTPGNQKVASITNGGGSIDRYWVPLGKMEVKDDKGYVNASETLAVQRSVFTTHFVHPKLGATIGTNTFIVYGNVKGVLDHWDFS
ncbi:hypothetical protein [Paenibacillus sp.]|uniref:hypothetical protein n=1 Tax=Paenibacillus sp. TaxID=58172 RepID=UPI0028AFA3DE|nr:hypothetical protein [Paenibacillus sp.]